VRFRLEQVFNLPLEDVEATFIDPDFLERLSELPRLGRAELLERAEDGPMVRQWIRYHFEGQLSSAVTKVVDPKRLTWVEESILDRRVHRTTFVIVPDHYGHRFESSGTFTLQANDDDTRTTRVTEGDVKVHFPFVGGKVERAIVFTLEAWDINCPQHIRKRFSQREVQPMIDELQGRIAELEATVAQLQRGPV
jgi:hypothetical protein